MPRKADKAMGPSGYERIEGDFYETEEKWTQGLVPHIANHMITLDEPIWECAAGAGAISMVLERNSFDVIATDLEDRGHPDVQSGVNFLTATKMPELDGKQSTIIITNPPYSKAEEFIRKALELTKPHGGAVMMFLRNEYDMAKTRRDLFEKPPFAMKIVQPPGRPRWIKDSKGAPRHCYAWYIWNHLHRGPATILYV